MAYTLTEKAKEIVRIGNIKMRVMRSGMFQQMTFNTRKVKSGNIEYTELFIDRIMDTSELLRLAKETGLPVESQNGRAFPEGSSASDFQGL
jgi:hypothetical protein